MATVSVRQVRKAFGRNGFLASIDLPVAPRASSRVRRVHPGSRSAARPFEQVNLVLGVNGFTRHDERRYPLGMAVGAGQARLDEEPRAVLH